MSASRGAFAPNSSACIPAHGLQRRSAFSHARAQTGRPLNCSVPLIQSQASDLRDSRRPSVSHRCHGSNGSDSFFCPALFAPSESSQCRTRPLNCTAHAPPSSLRKRHFSLNPGQSPSVPVFTTFGLGMKAASPQLSSLRPARARRRGTSV
jgi:hypothetical protein